MNECKRINVQREVDRERERERTLLELISFEKRKKKEKMNSFINIECLTKQKVKRSVNLRGGQPHATTY